MVEQATKNKIYFYDVFDSHFTESQKYSIFSKLEKLLMGVPGEMFEKSCFEITIERTFVNLKQQHDGHPIGRHYASLNAALTDHSDDGTIILRTD